MSDVILLILEILHRAALILGVIYAFDYAHNGKIDLPHKVGKWKTRDPISKLLMKIADKLESAHEARKRAWEFRVRR